MVKQLNEVDLDEILAWYTDDFVRQDRRRLIGAPEVDAAGFVGQILSWFEIEDGRPVFSPVAIIAVAGERCAALQMRIGFVGDRGVEMIHVVVFDELIQRQQRVVSFDVDDHDSAVGELLRLHAEYEAEDG
jgi:hypothetical protein